MSCPIWNEARLDDADPIAQEIQKTALCTAGGTTDRQIRLWPPYPAAAIDFVRIQPPERIRNLLAITEDEEAVRHRRHPAALLD